MESRVFAVPQQHHGCVDRHGNTYAVAYDLPDAANAIAVHSDTGRVAIGTDTGVVVMLPVLPQLELARLLPTPFQQQQVYVSVTVATAAPVHALALGEGVAVVVEAGSAVPLLLDLQLLALTRMSQSAHSQRIIQVAVRDDGAVASVGEDRRLVVLAPDGTVHPFALALTPSHVEFHPDLLDSVVVTELQRVIKCLDFRTGKTWHTVYAESPVGPEVVGVVVSGDLVASVTRTALKLFVPPLEGGVETHVPQSSVLVPEDSTAGMYAQPVYGGRLCAVVAAEHIDVFDAADVRRSTRVEVPAPAAEVAAAVVDDRRRLVYTVGSRRLVVAAFG